MHLTDSEIIAAIKSGNDNEALGFLYKKSLPLIKSFVLKNGGTQDDAYDIFQDGVTAFYRYVITDKFRKEFEIQGFIYTICKNLWINKTKLDKRTIRIDKGFEIQDEFSVLNDIISREREIEVARLLSKLGDRCEELLTYAFYQKLSAKKICELMGFANEDTVKTKKYKCKQRLLEIIKESTINEFIVS